MFANYKRLSALELHKIEKIHNFVANSQFRAILYVRNYLSKGGCYERTDCIG